MGDEIVLDDAEAASWAARTRAALGALRLNQHFLPAQAVAAWWGAMAASGAVALESRAALPTVGAWAKARATVDLAPVALAEIDGVDRARLPAAAAARLSARAAELAAHRALPELPARRMVVQLRHREGDQASWKVQLDVIDPVSSLLSRYTLIVSDRPGRHVDAGELNLRASDRLSACLQVLGGQDAALAFAVLRDEAGMRVEEVVRGVIGPAWLPGRAGPPALSAVGAWALSAALERASLDTPGGRVDDPLADAIVLPDHGQPFGVVRQRKWATLAGGVAPLQQWLAARGSRNLVYPVPGVD